MKAGKYNWIHSLAAAIVMIAAVSHNFWHTFLYGNQMATPPARMLVNAISMQIGLVGLLLLALWASTLFIKDEAPAPKSPGRIAGLKQTLRYFVPICAIAFALLFLSAQALEKVFHIAAHEQDLVQWIKPGTYSAGVRSLLVFVAVFEAPLAEELLFRGIMFRGLAKIMPAFAAMAISGGIFSIIHVNAQVFVPLWFLGIAFAWLYHRTGTILAPLAAHFSFNLLNLILVFSGVTN